MHHIESCVIRRSICGESTRQYHRWFTDAIAELKDNPLETLNQYWIRRGWPTDELFVPCLITFALYKREFKKCRLIVDTLEESYGHKEKVDRTTLTVEHVMPQSIGSDASGNSWCVALGEGWFVIHQEWLHSLGNLTLSGYNQEMSNKAYDKKRNALLESKLVLNQYFAAAEDWNGQAIERRGTSLAKQVASVWPALDQEGGAHDKREAIVRVKPSDFDSAALRQHCIERIERHLALELTDDSEARYMTGDRKLAIVCLASKPYNERNGILGYWFGFTREQKAFLNEANESHVALGCGSPDQLLLIPTNEVESWLGSLHTTEGRHWHLLVDRRDNRFELELPKLGEKADVSRFRI